MSKKLVIALGGNALGKTPEEQRVLVRNTAKSIVDLIEAGNQVIVSHGNGPQVGMINNAMEYSSQNGGNTPGMPFPECGAMSQGYIGYHLQQAIQYELRKRNIDRDCATIITQVVVNPDDPGFKNPTKPVGSFYTREMALKISTQKGFRMVEDAGRGYRRVVPSPVPQKIVELHLINKMIETGSIVIAAGGGGVPVVETEDGYAGVAAVIDKDRTSALLAKETNADMLLILTAVDQVCINYQKPNQKALSDLSVSEAEKYIAEKQFASGSMLPKVEACVDFVKSSKRGVAMITSLSKAAEALQGDTGTLIHQ